MQNNMGICETKQKMKQATIRLEDLWKFKDIYRPCVTMPNIQYRYEERNYNDFDDKLFGIYLTFPSQYKLIEQFQAITIHTLLGNGGGYVGLFLGNVFTTIFVA